MLHFFWAALSSGGNRTGVGVWEANDLCAMYKIYSLCLFRYFFLLVRWSMGFFFGFFAGLNSDILYGATVSLFLSLDLAHEWFIKLFSSINRISFYTPVLRVE